MQACLALLAIGVTLFLPENSLDGGKSAGADAKTRDIADEEGDGVERE